MQFLLFRDLGTWSTMDVLKNVKVEPRFNNGLLKIKKLCTKGGSSIFTSVLIGRSPIYAKQ